MSDESLVTFLMVAAVAGILCGLTFRLTGMPWWGFLLNIAPLGWALYSGAMEVRDDG